MSKIKNPVLTGFNPDPSMIFVDGVYYIATSTFEWYPGIRIYKSTDLANWELASTPLNRLSLLEMSGNQSSGGVWAPCLTYDEGVFFLVYSNVRSWIDTPCVDVENYLITCDKIDGVWSERTYLNSSGFDPSLYHDTDGIKYLLNMEWDFRKDFDNKFPGIILQEYDHKQKKLVGKTTNIFKGTALGFVEGPHIYKKDDYYYLFCAEGGTSWEHAESVSRSKNILGPYELHPNELIIKSGDRTSYLHKTGHASICQNAQGKWYLAHLCGRLTGNIERSVLGRETAIQELVWKEGWPYLIGDTNIPSNEFENYLDSVKIEKKISHYTFEDEAFLNDFQTLRIPYDEDIFSINKNKGYLTISGKESIFSKHKQALIARRQTDFDFSVETEVDFEPEAYQEMAGLIYRYNEDNQFYLFLTYDEEVNRTVVSITSVVDKEVTNLPVVEQISYNGVIILGLQVKTTTGQFYIIQNSLKTLIGVEFDVTTLSDEFAKPMGFTGAFIGMCVQDLKLRQKEAIFKSFTYNKR